MVIPRAAPSNGMIAVASSSSSLSASAFADQATDFSDRSVLMLLVFTSLAFLLPARASFLLGRLWHAWIFMLMAIVCVAYHLSGSSLHVVMDMNQSLTLAHHGWAYFCFLQMAYMVLGPEDPHMQWIDHPVVLDTPGTSISMGAPFHAIVIARVLPLGAIAYFLSSVSSVEDFHWQMIVLCDVLLFFGCGVFWLHRDRRSSLSKVLLRMRFWKRLWNRCALPVLLASFLWAAIESTDYRIMQAVWHVLSSVLAASIIRVVADNSGDLHSEAEIMNVSPQNPVVARILLGSVAIFGLPTIFFSLVLDWWSVGYWRWPMICQATHQRPGGYFVIIGALPTLLAQAATFWLIGSTVGGPYSDPEEIVLSKQFGCIIGYLSVGFGLLSLAIPDSVSPFMHTLCMILFLCLTMMAILLITLSASRPLAPGFRMRSCLTFVVCVLITSFLMLFILVQQYVENTYRIPHWMLALCEYATLAVPTLWPLTWGEEVQSRWRVHKVWRTFGDRMA